MLGLIISISLLVFSLGLSFLPAITMYVNALIGFRIPALILDPIYIYENQIERFGYLMLALSTMAFIFFFLQIVARIYLDKQITEEEEQEEEI